MNATFLLNTVSENPERLFRFYRDVVGLPFREGMGENAVAAGGATIAFDTHRDLCGQAMEPSRFLADFRVADAKAERERMEANGATFIRKEGAEAWGGMISTFVDPDGNYGQLMQAPGDTAGPGEVFSFTLDVTSDDPDRLFDFYRDVVGLEPFPAIGPHGLKVSDGAIMHFDTHSETYGPAREPVRQLVDFMVEDLAAEQARMEAAGARFFRKQGREFWGGLVSSCLDPDGNIVQIIEYREELDTTRAES